MGGVQDEEVHLLRLPVAGATPFNAHYCARVALMLKVQRWLACTCTSPHFTYMYIYKSMATYAQWVLRNGK